MLRFCESFDYYNTAQLGLKWDVLTGGPTVSSAAARNGSGGMISNSGGVYAQKNVPNSATLTAGFALYVEAIASGRMAMAFRDGSSNQVYLEVTATGDLVVGRGSTNLASTSSPMSFNAWHYIEIQATFATGTGGSITVNVDGVAVLSLTGVNTSQSGNAFAGGVLLGSTQALENGTFYYDDVYITDTTGSNNTSFLGDIKVMALLPAGNGTQNNFSQNAASWSASTVMAVGQQIIDSNGALQRVVAITGDNKTGSGAPTWQATVGLLTTDNHVTWQLVQKTPLSNFNFVNESPADDDSSYVSSSTVGNLDRYVFSPVVATSIAAIAVNLVARKDDSSTRTIRAVTLSGSTQTDNGSDFALSQSAYANYQGIFETDPNTGVAWNSTGANNAEFGIKETA